MGTNNRLKEDNLEHSLVLLVVFYKTTNCSSVRAKEVFNQ